MLVTGIATLPLGPLAFALTMGLDLDLDLGLLPLGSTVVCLPLVGDSGAFTGADVALNWLILRTPGCGEGGAPDPLAGSAVRAGTGDGLPKAACGEPALTPGNIPGAFDLLTFPCSVLLRQLRSILTFERIDIIERARVGKVEFDDIAAVVQRRAQVWP